MTETYYKAFAPRIGLAYSPGWLGTNKMVVRAAFGMFYNPVEQFVLLQFNGNPPFGASTFISDSGFANPFVDQSGNPWPSPYPYSLPQPGQPVDFNQFYPILMYGQFLPDQRTQYMAQYNLMLEYQLSPSMLVAAGYVGSQGHRLLANYDMNPGNPELCLQLARQGCGPFAEDSNYVGPSGETIFGTRPAGAFSNNGRIEAVSNVFAQHTISNSNYHSLQTRIERRSTSLQFLASYTFSKSIDNASGSQNLLNPFCFRCDRTLSGFDVRHRFVFSYTYRLPLKPSSRSGAIGKCSWTAGKSEGSPHFQSGIPVRLMDTGSDNSLSWRIQLRVGGSAGCCWTHPHSGSRPERVRDPTSSSIQRLSDGAARKDWQCVTPLVLRTRSQQLGLHRHQALHLQGALPGGNSGPNFLICSITRNSTVPWGISRQGKCSEGSFQQQIPGSFSLD